MPAVTANLSQAAFDIWDRIPKKERKSPLGAKGAEGRSAWLSSVIIQHEGWQIRYDEMVKGYYEMEKLVRIGDATIADLQRRIHE